MSRWQDPEFIKDVEAAEDSLPESFWELPETFIDSPKVRDMYTELYKKLLRENPERDTIELMMIERAAALYAYMRSIEASQGFSNPTSYRQLSSLWQTMATDLRKTRSTNFDEAMVREEVTLQMVKVINESLQGFDPQTANTVRRRLAAAMESIKE